MPLYDFRCRLCGDPFETQVPYLDRDVLQDCPRCGKAACGERIFSVPPGIGTAVPKGEHRLIYNESQVRSSHGNDWRAAGTNRRPGGVGAKTIVDMKR
jgi:putative FmdB family regulatory protein